MKKKNPGPYRARLSICYTLPLTPQQDPEAESARELKRLESIGAQNIRVEFQWKGTVRGG